MTNRRFKITAFASLFFLASWQSPALADDDTDAQIAKLKKDTELVVAKKAKFDADKALADAEKASTDASAQALATLQSQKATADAQKSLADSETQAWIAKNIGTVTAGPYTGAVGLNDKAGSLEALLLASKAVGACAQKLVSEVRPKLGCQAGSNADCKENLFVYRGSQFPSFQPLVAFRFRSAYIQRVLNDAIGNGKDVARDAHLQGPQELVPLPLIAAGVDAIGKLLGFAKTDTTVNGIEAKLDEDVLLNTVAGAFTDPKVDVHVPSLYAPSVDTTITEFSKQIGDLEKSRSDAVDLLKRINTGIAAENKKATAAKKADEKKAHTELAARLQPGADSLTAAIALFDAFASYLTTADVHGDIPLASIAAQASIQKALDNGKVLLLRLETTGGGSLVKKNLLTGLGAMPLYHMGGAAISYVLLNGRDGKVLAGNVIPYFGGYTRTDALAQTLGQ